MGSQLYRMKKEGTQYSDLHSGWTLAWPKDSPPQAKPLPREIGGELQNRLDHGSIVPVQEDELTGEEVVSGNEAADVPAIGGQKLTADGKIHPDHVAAYKVYPTEENKDQPELGTGAAVKVEPQRERRGPLVKPGGKRTDGVPTPRGATQPPRRGKTTKDDGTAAGTKPDGVTA